MVFGDIGTSPLYTFNSIFTELHAVPEPADVQQAFSVMFWTLTWMTLASSAAALVHRGCSGYIRDYEDVVKDS